MKLIVQPDAGVAPIVKAIKGARKTLDIVIFRFDRLEIEKALAQAVDRGVNVRALIAHTNKGGDKTLRKLELRLLECGATVARTADDLPRYHGKMMIVDKVLHVYGFNYTKLDIDKSRSFGLMTNERKLVQEAKKLFEADFNRHGYNPCHPRLVISPENSRALLTAFNQGRSAKKELLIYDAQVSDNAVPEGPRRAGQAPASRSASSARSRRTSGASRCASWGRCACTSAPSCATAARRSSAARACANWSWKAGVKSGSSSQNAAHRRARSSRCSRPTGRSPA